MRVAHIRLSLMCGTILGQSDRDSLGFAGISRYAKLLLSNQVYITHCFKKPFFRVREVGAEGSNPLTPTNKPLRL